MKEGSDEIGTTWQLMIQRNVLASLIGPCQQQEKFVWLEETIRVMQTSLRMPIACKALPSTLTESMLAPQQRKVRKGRSTWRMCSIHTSGWAQPLRQATDCSCCLEWHRHLLSLPLYFQRHCPSPERTPSSASSPATVCTEHKTHFAYLGWFHALENADSKKVTENSTALWSKPLVHHLTHPIP